MSDSTASKSSFFVKTTATFFGIGFVSFIGPTWASAVAALIAWYSNTTYLLILTGVFVVIGFWACKPSQTVFNSKDPREFVMDEVCGMMSSVLWLPKTIGVFIAAFVLFRILDACKPWPISKIQNSKHAWSIMGDDLAAGLVTNLILRFVGHWF